MSLKSRLNGLAGGLALAMFAAAAVVVVGGVILVGGAGMVMLLSLGGVPWYITVPGFYFLIWALIGSFWFGGEDKPKTDTATV
jgi:hypothetical protein